MAKKSPSKSYQVTNFRNLTYEDLSCLFGCSINDAAKKLQVSETYLKRLCRTFGIARWPYRRIKSLQEQRAKLQMPHDEQQISKIESEIENLLKNGGRDNVSATPSPRSPYEIMRITHTSRERRSPTLSDTLLQPTSYEHEQVLETVLTHENVKDKFNVFHDYAPLGFKLRLNEQEIISLLGNK
jgi:AraC-like DNA-binding protein